MRQDDYRQRDRQQRRCRIFDLEDPISLRRLEEPMTALVRLKGLVVINEA